MKLLCVDCDEAMTLAEARGPDEGSMTVIFSCSTCGRKTAMLTNAMETQVVRSLGVKIGGRRVSHEPMETVRDGLSDAQKDWASSDESAGTAGNESSSRSGSTCPFTDMVEEAYSAPDEDELRWTDAARQRLDRIPSMARSMARKGIEDYAREHGHTTIDESVMDAVKGRFGF